MTDRFTASLLLGLSKEERLQRCQELAEILSARLVSEIEFHETVRQLVNELRLLGHDLWSFDEDDDREVWSPSWAGSTGPGIIVTFRPTGVEIEWPTRGP